MNNPAASSTHADPLLVCDECDFQTREPGDLEPIKDLTMRVGPGESMPDGQCPNCGALVREQDVGVDPGEPTISPASRVLQLDAVDQALAVCDTLLSGPCSDIPPGDLRQKRLDLDAGLRAAKLLRCYGNLTAHPLAALSRLAFAEIRTLADAHGPNVWAEGTATSKRYKIAEACVAALRALDEAPPVRIVVQVVDGIIETRCNYQAQYLKLDFDCDGDISEDVRRLANAAGNDKGCYVLDETLDPDPAEVDDDFDGARNSTDYHDQGEG